MAASTAQIQTNEPKKVESDYISLERFLAEYSDKEDGFKYEWNDGEVEKTHAMNQTQQLIFRNLMRFFVDTSIFKEGGVLSSEVNMRTSKKQLRRPNLAIFSNKQVINFDDSDATVPAWVAEVISESDNINRVERKLDEYFQAGVKVVWHIFPISEKIYVYTSPTKVKICVNKAICSSLPALKDFEIVASDIFAK